MRPESVEAAIFGGIVEQLTKPEWLNEFSSWFRQRLATGQKARAASSNVDGKRLNTLNREISNVTDAIVRGDLRSSPALAAKLRELEPERQQLAQERSPASNVVPLVPSLTERYKAMVKDLPTVARKDPDRARMLLRRLIGPIRIRSVDGQLVAQFVTTGEQMTLAACVPSGVRDLGGAGGGT